MHQDNSFPGRMADLLAEMVTQEGPGFGFALVTVRPHGRAEKVEIVSNMPADALVLAVNAWAKYGGAQPAKG